MTSTLMYVIYMAILTWLTILASSLIRAKGWTFAGTMIAFGNRENLPEATPLAGRAARTAQNTLENFMLFTAIALVAHAAGVANPNVAMGAQVFFWSRVLYVPIYYAGIIYLRTAVWLASIIGLAMMITAVL